MMPPDRTERVSADSVPPLTEPTQVAIFHHRIDGKLVACAPIEAIRTEEREKVLGEVREKLEGAKSVEAAAAALHDWREKDDPTGPIEESADPEYRRREPLWWDEMVAAGQFPGDQKEIREEAIAMLAAVIPLASLPLDAMEEPRRCETDDAPMTERESEQGFRDDPPDSLDRGEAGQPEIDRICGDVSIKVTELIERVEGESAPEKLWETKRESAWLQGRDDTGRLIREELDGYIRQGLELAGFDCTDQPAPKEAK